MPGSESLFRCFPHKLGGLSLGESLASLRVIICKMIAVMVADTDQILKLCQALL